LHDDAAAMFDLRADEQRKPLPVRLRGRLLLQSRNAKSPAYERRAKPILLICVAVGGQGCSAI
jgi:hypothetical protein